MNAILQILLIEDSPDDADLLLRQLRRGGLQFAFEQICTTDQLIAKLEAKHWDVIISDYWMPTLNASQVLAILQQRGIDTPFLVVSGTIGETMAVELMKAGAHDYVMKDNLHRLPAVVERELREAEERRARRHAEKELHRNEERYRLLFDSNPQPMWVYDLETFRFLAVNRAAVRHYGYSLEEFLGMTIKDIRPIEDLGALEDNIAKTEPGLSVSGAWTHLKKDGARIQVEISSHDLDFEGRRARLVLSNDVTDRLDLELQLRQSQKMEAVGRLAGGVAHDFNNLLTAIGGYTELTLMRMPADDPLRSNLDEIGKASERAAGLTRQLLAFSRQQVLQPKVLNLNDIVLGLEKMLKLLVGEDVAFTTVLDKGLGRVKADSGQIEQVIMNLVVNARDAMPVGGQLTIESSNVVLDESYAQRHVAVQSGPHVMLSVSDTGCGMDERTQARVFEPFFTTKEPGKGTGLGLSTAYGIVKQSGGNIWVYSVPGRGTTFKVYLPRVEQEVDLLQPAGTSAPSYVGTETILLVEDEDLVRGVTRQILRTSGYTVLEASDGPEALKLCEKYEGQIDLVVTDVVMPGLSGREMVQLLSHLRPDIRVLFISGYTDDAVIRHGVLEPGTQFLQKPFTAKSLTKKLREVLELSAVSTA